MKKPNFDFASWYDAVTKINPAVKKFDRKFMHWAAHNAPLLFTGNKEDYYTLELAHRAWKTAKGK